VGQGSALPESRPATSPHAATLPRGATRLQAAPRRRSQWSDRARHAERPEPARAPDRPTPPRRPTRTRPEGTPAPTAPRRAPTHPRWQAAAPRPPPLHGQVQPTHTPTRSGSSTHANPRLDPRRPTTTTPSPRLRSQPLERTPLPT